MGVELCGYHYIGPRDVRPYWDEIALQVKKVLDFLAKMKAFGESDEDTTTTDALTDELTALVGDCYYDDAEAFYDRYQWLLGTGVESYTNSVCDKYRDLWYSSDASLRELDDDESIVVFAGSMTWGDSPDGESYQFLEEVSYLGLDKAMRLR